MDNIKFEEWTLWSCRPFPFLKNRKKEEELLMGSGEEEAEEKRSVNDILTQTLQTTTLELRSTLPR